MATTKVATQQDRAEVAAGAPAIIMEAIVKRRAVVTTYNLAEVTLAPHILYTRHGELHVDAITLERDGKAPKEIKIGTFRLSGLGNLRISPRSFQGSSLFRMDDPRYAGVTLMAIDPV